MAYKNTATTVHIFAWDTINGVGKTGDSANITTRGVGDGSEFTLSSPSITEIDSTNLKGVYSVSLTAGENNYTNALLGGISSTAGVLIQPVSWTNEVTADVAKWKTGTVPAVNQTGVPLVDLTYILGTILTETSGQIAAGFKKFFNIATPAATMDHGILVDTVTTLTNAPADSTTLTEINADVDEIITTLGTAGAGLTTLGDTRIANLDATVSSRLASGSYTAPDNTTITAINAKTTNLPPDPADASDIAALFAAIPAAVWSYVTRTITSGGITAAQVWDYLTSSISTSGSIGKLLKDDIDATISSRATPSDVQTKVAAELDAAGAEISAIPTGSSSLRSKINYLFQYFGFKRTASNTVETLYKEDSSTPLGTATISNSGTLFTKNKVS